MDLNKELVDLRIISEEESIEMGKAAGLTSGYLVWEHYKNGLYYTLPQILEWINQFKNLKSDLDIFSLNDQNLINRLHWNLYHHQHRQPLQQKCCQNG